MKRLAITLALAIALIGCKSGCCQVYMEMQSVTASQSIVTHTMQQAMNGSMYHSHGGYPYGARYEGVGWSTAGPWQALRNCCYYGRRPLVEWAVWRGRRGWYATARYR